MESWEVFLFTGFSRPFLSVFLEGNFPHGWQWRTYNCTYPKLIVWEARVGLKLPLPIPEIWFHCSATPCPPTQTLTNHLLWAACALYHEPQVSCFAVTLRLDFCSRNRFFSYFLLHIWGSEEPQTGSHKGLTAGSGSPGFLEDKQLPALLLLSVHPRPIDVPPKGRGERSQEPGRPEKGRWVQEGRKKGMCFSFALLQLTLPPGSCSSWSFLGGIKVSLSASISRQGPFFPRPLRIQATPGL